MFDMPSDYLCLKSLWELPSRFSPLSKTHEKNKHRMPNRECFHGLRGLG